MDGELEQCMQRYGSDKSPKSNVHAYTAVYDELFRGRRDITTSVLEIGIGYRFYKGHWMKGNKQYITGASLRAWRDYFPNAHVYGCDIARHILFQDDRISTFFMDQSKQDQASVVERSVPAESRPLDIIVDDGSHIPEHQFLSAIRLFPLVRDGGIYVVEDVKRSNLAMFEPAHIDAFAKKSGVGAADVAAFRDSIMKVERRIDFGPFKDKNNEGLIVIHKAAAPSAPS